MRHSLIAMLWLVVVVALAACGGSPSPTATPVSPSPSPTIMIGPIRAASTAVVTATPLITLVPRPTTASNVDRYVVRSGDTLSGIATRFDIDVQDLMQANGLKNANTIQIGQVLRIPVSSTRVAPAISMVPDSEAVYSPAYASFDAVAFATAKGGYLVNYREKVDGESMSGPQIIQIIAERYSVGPRVLLALLEFESGWVTNKLPGQTQISYSMGLIDPSKATLFYQASWAANHLNEGYYGKLSGQFTAFQFKDRTRARVASGVNPGSVAIENVLALNASWDAWLGQTGPTGFMATYRNLFGDPTPIDPLIPANLQQPPLRLPWKTGGSWYFTGGPHSPWGDYAAWGALDVTPMDVAAAGCIVSKDWAIAAAPGRVVRSEHGRVILSLGNDKVLGTGWNLLYMHMAPTDRVAEGTQVERGGPIGHPSCEGGYSTASHLHFARLYNGQWMDPVTVPYVVGGWQVIPADQDYDGKMIRGSDTREALNARNDLKNLILADDTQ